MWSYNDDGTVTVELIGRNAMLRRPKVGEFKMLRQTLEAAQATASERAIRLSLRASALAQMDAEQRNGAAEELAWIRQETIEVRNISDDIRTMWLTLVLTTLDADGRAPNEDEYPPDFLEGDWQSDIIQHWLTGRSKANPTVPGVE